MKPLKGLFTVFALSGCLSAAGQALFSDNFDSNTSANYTLNRSSTDTAITYLFDYSTMGIPSAPNSGGTTLGVKFEANMTLGVAAALNISPIGQSFNGDYQLRYDMWINANGPFPGGGAGSTEYARRIFRETDRSASDGVRFPLQPSR